MRKEIEVGDYLLSMDAVPCGEAAEAGAPDIAENGETAAPPPERYAIRVRVTRVDRQPLHGSTLADDSGEMTDGHGPFKTVAEAIAHGEA